MVSFSGAVASLVLLALAASAQAGEPLVRVRLAAGRPEIRLRGLDLAVSDRPVDARGGRGAGGVSRLLATCDARGVTLRSEDAPGSPPLRAGARRVEVRSPAGFLNAQGQPLRETAVIVAAGPGRCDLINELPLEKYLEGVVNGEVSSSWPREAIAAQVVAARSYALEEITRARARGRDHDLESDERDQVYAGVLREDAPAARAVQSTRGLVLAAAGAPLRALYHSTCGGQTQPGGREWGGPAGWKFRGVTCPYCHASPAFAWTLSLSEAEIRAAVLRAGVQRTQPNPGTAGDWRTWIQRGWIQDFGPAAEGGRSERLRIVFSAGAVEVSAARFRKELGPSRVRSTWFEAGRGAGGAWTLSGRGYGHGVGMCQWGARGFAARGWKAAAILSHYYPDAKLRRMW